MCCNVSFGGSTFTSLNSARWKVEGRSKKDSSSSQPLRQILPLILHNPLVFHHTISTNFGQIFSFKSSLFNFVPFLRLIYEVIHRPYMDYIWTYTWAIYGSIHRSNIDFNDPIYGLIYMAIYDSYMAPYIGQI